MPCVKNGRVVPGAKGSCPLDSTWSETNPSFYGEDQKLGLDDVGNWLKQRYTTESGNTDYTKAGIEGLMAIYGGGLARAGLTKGLPAVMKQFSKLYTKPKKVTTKVPEVKAVLKPGRNANSGPLPKSAYESVYKPATTTSEMIRKFSLPRAAGASAVGAAGLDYVAPFTQAGLENKQARDANAALIAQQTTTETNNAADATALAEQTALAEKQRVEGLGFFDRMKEPGYWDTSLTGVEGDDRMSRLGDLLRYYGMPPSGRANELSPSEQWAQRSIDAATVAAKEASNNAVNSQYSKIGNKTGIEAIEAEVEKDFGNTWLPFDVALGARLNDKEVEALAKQLHIAIVNLAQMPEHQGKNTLQLYEIAKKDYEKSVR